MWILFSEFPGLLGSIFHLQHSGRSEYKILSRHLAWKHGLPGDHHAGIHQLLSQSTHLHNLQSGVQEGLQENLRIGSLIILIREEFKIRIYGKYNISTSFCYTYVALSSPFTQHSSRQHCILVYILCSKVQRSINPFHPAEKFKNHGNGPSPQTRNVHILNLSLRINIKNINKHVVFL